MLIGVDFDNTIVSYDEAFRLAAAERSLLADGVASTKEEVRDQLRAAGREDDWTELQGYVYGPGMIAARPFAGVQRFFERCREMDVEVAIVSHKTKTPYRGPEYDLHEAARSFLRRHELTAPAFFELTKEAKLSRIGTIGCTDFVDDLPEFLIEPGFPGGVRRVLFDPNESETCARVAAEHGLDRVGSWALAESRLLGS